MAVDVTQWIVPEMAKQLQSKNAIASIMDHAKFARHNIAGGWGNHSAHPGLTEAYLQVVKEGFHAATRYSETSGMPALKQAIATKLELGYFGRGGANEQTIAITTGSTQATYQLLQLLCDGTKGLLTTDPVYANITDQSALLGVKVHSMPIMDEQGHLLSDEAIEAMIAQCEVLLKSRSIGAIFLVSPCNPTSRFLPDELVIRLVVLAGEYNTPVVIDGAYSVFYYGKLPGQLNLSLSDYPNLIRLESFSKTFSLLGERLGYVVADPSITKALSALTQRITLCPARLPQEVAARFLDQISPDELREYIATTRDTYKLASKRTADILQAHGLQCIESDGGFYTTFKLPLETDGTVADDLVVCDRIFAGKGILTVPGSAFGPSLKGWIRTSFAPHIQDPQRMEAIYTELAEYLAPKG